MQIELPFNVQIIASADGQSSLQLTGISASSVDEMIKVGTDDGDTRLELRNQNQGVQGGASAILK